MDARVICVARILPAMFLVMATNVFAEPGDERSEQPEPPQLLVVDDGNIALDMGGCTVLFSPSGQQIAAGSSCSDADLGRARDALDRYRREQAATAQDEAPPGGFGSGDGGDSPAD